jgi:hypothetical protein
MVKPTIKVLKDEDGTLRSPTTLKRLGYWYAVDAVIYYILLEKE